MILPFPHTHATPCGWSKCSVRYTPERTGQSAVELPEFWKLDGGLTRSSCTKLLSYVVAYHVVDVHRLMIDPRLKIFVIIWKLWQFEILPIRYRETAGHR